MDLIFFDLSYFEEGDSCMLIYNYTVWLLAFTVYGLNVSEYPVCVEFLPQKLLFLNFNSL